MIFPHPVISVQVLQELFVNLIRKNVSDEEAHDVVKVWNNDAIFDIIQNLSGRTSDH